MSTSDIDSRLALIKKEEEQKLQNGDDAKFLQAAHEIIYDTANSLPKELVALIVSYLRDGMTSYEKFIIPMLAELNRQNPGAKPEVFLTREDFENELKIGRTKFNFCIFYRIDLATIKVNYPGRTLVPPEWNLDEMMGLEILNSVFIGCMLPRSVEKCTISKSAFIDSKVMALNVSIFNSQLNAVTFSGRMPYELIVHDSMGELIFDGVLLDGCTSKIREPMWGPAMESRTKTQITLHNSCVFYLEFKPVPINAVPFLQNNKEIFDKMLDLLREYTTEGGICHHFVPEVKWVCKILPNISQSLDYDGVPAITILQAFFAIFNYCLRSDYDAKQRFRDELSVSPPKAALASKLTKFAEEHNVVIMPDPNSLYGFVVSKSPTNSTEQKHEMKASSACVMM